MQATKVICAYLRILSHCSYVFPSFPLTLTTLSVAIPGCFNATWWWGQQNWGDHRTCVSGGPCPQSSQQHLQRGISQEHFIHWFFRPTAKEKWQPDPLSVGCILTDCHPPTLRSPPGDSIKTKETLSSAAFAGQQYAWTTSEHAGTAFSNTSW